MRTFITVLITVVVVLVLLGGVGAYVAKRKGAGQEPTAVRIEKPQRGSLTEFVSAPGDIEPRQRVEISAKVSARVKELPCPEGTAVTRGDARGNGASVLVRLDATDLEAALASTEARYQAQQAQLKVNEMQIGVQAAQVRSADIALEQAQLHLTRQKELLATSDVSQAAYDDAASRVAELQAQLDASRQQLRAAELNLEVMRYNLQAAEAEIARARDNLSYTTIYAPLDGVVTRILVEVGEVVTGAINYPGTVIMHVADLSEMLVAAQVDQTDIGRVEVGQHARIHIHAYADREFTGRVTSIALTHTPGMGSKSFETKVLIDSEGERLLGGLTADVEIETERHEDVLRVPSQAILARATDDLPLNLREDNPAVDINKAITTVVYRLIDGKAVVTPVMIGPSDNTHSMIESGLTEDDQVIVGPYKVLESIQHDQKVRDERQAKNEAEGAEADETAASTDAAETAEGGDSDESASTTESESDSAVEQP